MWTLVFNKATNIGTGCNREPNNAEFAVTLHPTQCAWFNIFPQRYRWSGGKIEEILNVSLYLVITEAVAVNKANCKRAILTKYSAETQRNAALGLYDYDPGVKEAIVDFIARCVTLEDSITDGLQNCTTVEQLGNFEYTEYPTE